MSMYYYYDDLCFLILFLQFLQIPSVFYNIMEISSLLFRIVFFTTFCLVLRIIEVSRFLKIQVVFVVIFSRLVYTWRRRSVIPHYPLPKWEDGFRLCFVLFYFFSFQTSVTGTSVSFTTDSLNFVYTIRDVTIRDVNGVDLRNSLKGQVSRLSPLGVLNYSSFVW